jgi:hypothetical protein
VRGVWDQGMSKTEAVASLTDMAERYPDVANLYDYNMKPGIHSNS